MPDGALPSYMPCSHCFPCPSHMVGGMRASAVTSMCISKLMLVLVCTRPGAQRFSVNNNRNIAGGPNKPVVLTFRTVSLRTLLAKAQAPPVIDYLSLDIEVGHPY